MMMRTKMLTGILLATTSAASMVVLRRLRAVDEATPIAQDDLGKFMAQAPFTSETSEGEPGPQDDAGEPGGLPSAESSAAEAIPALEVKVEPGPALRVRTVADVLLEAGEDPEAYESGAADPASVLATAQSETDSSENVAGVGATGNGHSASEHQATSHEISVPKPRNRHRDRLLLSVLALITVGATGVGVQAVVAHANDPVVEFCAAAPLLEPSSTEAALDAIAAGVRGESTYATFEAGSTAYAEPETLPRSIDQARQDLTSAHTAVLATRQSPSDLSQTRVERLRANLFRADAALRAVCEDSL